MRNRIERRSRVEIEANPTGRLEERASLRGWQEPSLVPALFTGGREFEQGLVSVGQQIVQSVGFAPGVRQRPAAAHDAMEVLAVLVGEGPQHFDDRVPRRIRAPRDDLVSAQFDRTLRPEVARAGHERSVGRDVGRDGGGVEHAHVVGQPRCHEIGLEPGYGPCRDRRAAFEQGFEPCPEAAGVEGVVEARSHGAPQVEVGDARELRWCGQRQQLATGVQPAASDHLMQQFGGQPRDHLRQMRHVQDPLDERTRVLRLRRHGGAHAPRTRATNGCRHSGTPTLEEREGSR